MSSKYKNPQYKDNVRDCFSNSVSTYELVADAQLKVAKTLVEQLNLDCPNLVPQTILDLGAGTGFVTKELLKLFPKATYTLNDLSEEMLEFATSKLQHKEISTITGDIENIDFKTQELIISSLAFQWLEDIEEVIPRLYNKTSKVLAFTTLIDGTFLEWKTLFNESGANAPGLKYKTEEEIKTICNQLNAKHCHIVQKDFPIKFLTVLDCARYLKKLGAQFNPQGHVDSSLAVTLKNIAKRHAGEVKTNYKVLFVILEK